MLQNTTAPQFARKSLSANPQTAAPRSLSEALKPTFLLGTQARLPARPAAAPGLTDICVNGSWHSVSGRKISYSDVVRLAFPNNPARAIDTVTFRDGDPSWSFGEVRCGDAVPLVRNMRFWVSQTSGS